MRITGAVFLVGLAVNLTLACLAPMVWAADSSSDASAPAAADQAAAAPTPMPPQATALATTVTLRANSLVPLRTLEFVSSESSATGTRFKLEVTDDINVDDTIVIPAGSIAIGEIIYASKSGMLGKAGKLSVSARFVTVGDRAIKLHAALGSAGANKAMLALFIPFARGGKVEIPEGTQLVAKVATDEVFSVTAPVPVSTPAH